MIYGISLEEAVKSLEPLQKVMNELIMEYLTKEEIEEINNPKTSKRRINELINISNSRMLSDI